jgi:hypothetical protein
LSNELSREARGTEPISTAYSVYSRSDGVVHLKGSSSADGTVGVSERDGKSLQTSGRLNSFEEMFPSADTAPHWYDALAEAAQPWFHLAQLVPGQEETNISRF